MSLTGLDAEIKIEAGTNDLEDEDLVDVLGPVYGRQVIAARLRIRQARTALSEKKS